jgi:hypothetical protein
MDRRLAAAVVPPVMALVVTAVFIAAESSGAALLSHGQVRNIAEAAGLGSASEIVRLLDAGQDPQRVMAIRPEIISSSVRQASALEAAVWSRRVELVKLLDERSSIPAPERARLACLAQDLAVADIAVYLGGEAAAACVPNKVITSIQARGIPVEGR